MAKAGRTNATGRSAASGQNGKKAGSKKAGSKKGDQDAAAAQAETAPQPAKKRGRPPKADKAEGAAKPGAKTPKRALPEINPQDQALFVGHHLPKVIAARKAVADATNELRRIYKAAKGDGFLKCDFDDAIAITEAEGEKKKKAAIRRSLVVARWMGCDLGAQLDLFDQPERVPAADRAYEEGKIDCMQNKAARPSYDPSTEQYRRYMAGYHDETERRVQGGIKPIGDTTPQQRLIPKEEADAQAKAQAAQAQEQAEKPPAPSSGTPMTRSQFNAQRAGMQQKNDAKAEADKIFKKREPESAGEVEVA